MLQIDSVHQSTGARGCDPAATEHFEWAASLQRASRELLLQLGARNGPIGGQGIDDEIFETHKVKRREKSAQHIVYWRKSQAISAESAAPFQLTPGKKRGFCRVDTSVRRGRF